MVASSPLHSQTLPEVRGSTHVVDELRRSSGATPFRMGAFLTSRCVFVSEQRSLLSESAVRGRPRRVVAVSLKSTAFLQKLLLRDYGT